MNFRTSVYVALSGLLMSSATWALDAIITVLPEASRVWENRSNQEGAEYQNFRGSDVAFINQEGGGWYYLQQDGTWHLFHEGPRLDLQNSDSSITESLQVEVVAGTPFFGAGPAGQYGLLLDGATGELVTEDGYSFDPSQFELLRDESGQQAYYDIESGQWWPTYPLFESELQNTLKAPLYPLYLSPQMYPARHLFSNTALSAMTFDVGSLRYRNAAGEVAGFHPKISGSVRVWKNDSNMPCSPYSDYPGDDVVYANGVWYHKRSDTHFEEFFSGRYLSFDDQYGHAFLSVALSVGTEIGSQGDLASQSLQLDGESGELVGPDGTALDPQSYRRTAGEPLECGIQYVVVMDDSLVISGAADAPPFEPVNTSVTLLNVVPLRQIENNPFKGRGIVAAIQQSRLLTTNIVKVTRPPVGPAPDPDPVDPPPVPGTCPLDSPLTLLAALPEAAPLENAIGITGLNQLSAGFSVVPSEQVFRINNPLSESLGVVSMTSQFSYVSGSSLGSQPEGASLSYRVRRNSDSAEFDLSFTFQSEVVFDDLGIVITSISGRQCTAGGPL